MLDSRKKVWSPTKHKFDMEVRLAEIDEDCREELSHIIDAIYSQLEENVDVDKELITDSVKTVAMQLPVSVIELARIPGMKELVMNKWCADIFLGITQHYKQMKNELLMMLVSKLRKKTDYDCQQRKRADGQQDYDADGVTKKRSQQNTDDIVNREFHEKRMADIVREGQERGSFPTVEKTTNMKPPANWFGRLSQRSFNLGSPYSTKVYVGGVPLDISWPTVAQSLSQFGKVWAHPFLPHKGFLYFVFEDEADIQTLLAHCTKVFEAGVGVSYFYILHTCSGPKVYLNIYYITFLLNKNYNKFALL